MAKSSLSHTAVSFLGWVMCKKYTDEVHKKSYTELIVSRVIHTTKRKINGVDY